MTALQNKIDQRASLWTQMTTLQDDTGLIAGEHSVQYDRIAADFDNLDAEIVKEQERNTKHAERSASNTVVDRSGIIPARGVEDNDDAKEAYNSAFAAFIQSGLLDMDADARAALKKGFNAIDGKEIRNAGGIATGGAGGYLVPEGFREKVIEHQKAFGNVEGEAEVITTATGNPLPWATNDDTGNIGALLAENSAASEQDFVFGNAQLGAYKWTTKLFRESIEFLQDVSWMDLEKFLARKAGERLARAKNQYYTNGTGTGQPLGLITGGAVGVTSASPTAITADEFIDLQHAVDPAYRNLRSKYMLNDTTLKLARKLKDGQNRYLFQPATEAAGIPNLIAGAPYVVNQDVAAPTAANKAVAYGDFKTGYVVRNVLDMQFLRLAERYAEYGQVGFIGFERSDATVQDASAYAILQMHA